MKDFSSTLSVREEVNSIADGDLQFTNSRNRQLATLSDSSSVRLAQTEQQQTIDMFTKGIPLVVVGGLDTILQSVGIADENDIPEIINGINEPLGQFYRDNREGLQTLGDIGFSFLSITGLSKLIRTGSMLQKAYSKVDKSNTLTKFLFSTGKDVNAITKTARDQQTLFALKGVQEFTGANAPAALTAASRSAKFTSAADVFKEGVAADLGIWLLQGDSKTFFPDEMDAIENIVLFGAFDVLGGGVGYAIARASLRKNINLVAGPLAGKSATRNANRLKDPARFAEDLQSPGLRSVSITFKSTGASILRNQIAKGLDTVEGASARQELNTLEQDIQEIVTSMGSDNVVSGLTSSVKLRESQVKTGTEVVKRDNQTFANVLSIENFDPATSMKTLTKKKDTLKADVEGQLAELYDAKLLSKTTGEVAFTPADAEAVKALEAKRDLLDNMSMFVLEPGGDLVNLIGRKEVFQDTPEWFTKHIKTLSRTDTTDKTYKIAIKDASGKEQQILVTENLITIIPDADKQMVSGLPTVEIMPNVATAKNAKEFKMTLVDIGEDWHFKEGKRGKRVFAELPQETRQEIQAWTGTSGSAKLREWHDANDPRFKQVIDAYQNAGLHKRLSEVANPDGTITLYRGEAKAERVAPTNDIVSMTGDPAVAHKFGASRGPKFHDLTVRIPVDDIVMVVGGLGREVEYIVKGNRSRKFGEAVIQQSSFEALDLKSRTAMFAGLQKAISEYVPGESSKINLSLGDHWTRLDAAAEIASKYQADLGAFATTPSGQSFTNQVNQLGLQKSTRFNSIEDIEYASLREKYFEFDRMMTLVEASNADIKGLLKLPEGRVPTIADIVKSLNLPVADGGGIHPIVQMLLDLRVPKKDVKQVLSNPFDSKFKNMSDVKEAMVKLIDPRSNGNPLSPNLRTRGTQLDIPADQSPVTLLYNAKAEGFITREELVEAGIYQRAHMMDTLAKASTEGAPLVDDIVKAHLSRPDVFKESMGVFNLVQGGLSGKGILTTTAFQARDNSVISAVDILGDVSDKLKVQYVEAKMKQASAVYNKIFSRGREGDITSLRLVVDAKNEGWELAFADPILLDEGKKLFGIPLDADSAANKALWKEKFGREMPDDAVLPAPKTAKTADAQGAPLAISELAMNTHLQLSEIDTDILNQLNFLRKAQGKGPINFRPYHTPPANLANKKLVFLVDETGSVQRVIPGNNFSEAKRLADKELDALKEQGTQMHMLTEDDMARYFDAMNEVFGRPENFANARLVTGKIGGKLQSESIELGPDFLKSMIETQVRMYDSIFKETRALLYAPELSKAKHMQRASGIVDTDVKKARETIWDVYANRVYQKGQLNANSDIGRGYFFVESLYDKMLSKIFEKKVELLEAGKFAKEFGGSVEQKRAFNSLDKTLGPFNPYTDMLEFAQRSTSIPVPQTLRKHAAVLNKIVGFTALRILDAGMAVINLTSLGAVIPAVVKMNQRGASETVAEYTKRMAPFGFKLDDNVSMLSPTRASISGIHFMFTPEGHAVWKDAAKRGLLQQEIAERMSAFTAPTQGYLTRQVEKAATTLSWLTDKSETLSRGISFMTGYNLARKGMGLAHEEAMLFGHKFGNDVIGDFRPNNRPQMFQGATGMPLGLFTTFMWNFLQRMHGDLESKRFAALATQMGMQFSLFGANSLPGFDSFVQTFTDNYDGSVNMIDGMRARFGDDFVEWFLNGTLSTVPKMFGADTGIAVFSRAQIATPFTAGPLAGNVPSLTMIKRVGDILRDTYGQVKSRAGLSTSQLAETFSKYPLLRAGSNAIELYQGYSIDQRDQVIEADTRDAVGVISRMMGFSTTRKIRVQQEAARSRGIELRRRDIMNEARSSIRADLRDGSLSDENRRANLNRSLRRMIKAGVKADGFGQILSEQLMRGTVEKGQLKFIEDAKNSMKQGEAVRMLELLRPDNAVVDTRVNELNKQEQ